MYSEAFSDNPFASNCWLAAARGSSEAVVVDPGFSPGRLRSMLERAGVRPAAVLATHGHFDHVGAAAALCGDSIPFYIHEADARALSDPWGWGAGHEAPPVPVKDVRTVVDGDVLEFAGFRIEVWHTPGHTPGSVCYLTDDLVYSGDLVFAGSIGRHDFPNSSPSDMRASLRRFLTLRDPLPVHPGHGPTSSVGHERAENPFLLELA
jgi:hydroxyacylglutathione hydrolase